MKEIESNPSKQWSQESFDKMSEVIELRKKQEEDWGLGIGGDDDKEVKE